MISEKSVTGRAVVVGAGVMGAGIAALLANAGWEVDLLDRVPPDAGPGRDSRDRLATDGLGRALRARPPHFALPGYSDRVRVGNVQDDLGRAAAADWVVEAVAEDLATKRALFTALAPHVGRETVISSNTSGLSLAGMTSECPPSFRRRFLGTHFFNPPRYMLPVELIPTADTDPAVFEGFARFADRVLGKRAIRAKDTPGFISTRLGMFALAKTIQIAFERGIPIEQADYLTGPLIGRPRTGTFRLADVIGLDILVHIADNLAAALPGDHAYQKLRLPEPVRTLVREGRTGVKAGAGFYRRADDGSILGLDVSMLDYRPVQEARPYPPDVESLPLADRLRRIWELSPDRDSGFLQHALRTETGYMAGVTPEVADRIVEVDDALTGGFGWEMGPFHMLDALGAIEWPAGAPALVARLAESGEKRFYYHRDGKHFYFDFQGGKMKALPRAADVLVLKDLKRSGRTIAGTDAASLIDLGDGTACLEWRTRMGALKPEVVGFLDSARERAERDFAALVIAGGGGPFSVGYDLKLLEERIERHDWAGIDALLADFQGVMLRLGKSRVPVVSAVAGYALGGGCEVTLRTSAVQAAFESYVGLPEANVGLVPAGGGLAAMLRRALVSTLEPVDPFTAVERVWENLRLARFSSSADEARELGYLSDCDQVSRHPGRLLHNAKERALELANTSFRPLESDHIRALGEPGLARFRWGIMLLRRADEITEHDARVADRLAWVLCGGDLVHETEVAEFYILELERQALLSLAGTPETLARIRHMFSNSKPLRN